MHTRVSFILDRLNADFASVGIGTVALVEDPGPGWTGTVFEYAGHQTFGIPEHLEACTALLADQFQDDAMDNLGRTWPEVAGKPLFASADSGVACWCLNGEPWCAVGQLTEALAVYNEAESDGQVV
jgi:hypothetical protein